MKSTIEGMMEKERTTSEAASGRTATYASAVGARAVEVRVSGTAPIEVSKSTSVRENANSPERRSRPVEPFFFQNAQRRAWSREEE